MPATSGLISTSVETAAHPIDENASANVAIRDEVCRLRNWLRRACPRNQYWIAVAAAAAIAAPEAATSAARGDAIAIGTRSGVNTAAIAISTTSTLARITADGGNGIVAIRSGASSPEIDSQAMPPASWPAAITITGISKSAVPAPEPNERHIISAGGRR